MADFQPLTVPWVSGPAKSPDEAIVGTGFTLVDAGLLGSLLNPVEAPPEREPWSPPEPEPEPQKYFPNEDMPLPIPGGAIGSSYNAVTDPISLLMNGGA